MRITRLSLFNIRKHKMESISLFVLLLLCMTLLSSAATGIRGIDQIFESAYERTGCVRNGIIIQDKYFRQSQLDFLENDPRVTGIVEARACDSIGLLNFTLPDGEERSSIFCFITFDEDAKLETLELDSSMTQAEIMAGENYIVLPYCAKWSLGLREGDTFTITYHERNYPLRVAGFYESAFYSDFQSLKCIVSNADLTKFSKLFGSSRIYGLETISNEGLAMHQLMDDLRRDAERNSTGDEWRYLYSFLYSEQKSSCTTTSSLLISLMIAMSMLIFVAVAYMIRFRVRSDIDEQMINIGVLEALGYQSGEIALSYMLEYLIIAAPAVLLGLLLNIFASGLFLHVGEIMIGHRAEAIGFSVTPLYIGIVLLLFVGGISFLRASRIRKIPPVVAFRRGGEDHTHKHTILPLQHTKGSVHLRLAIKGFLADLKGHISMSLCIFVSVLSFVACFCVYSYIGTGIAAFVDKAGIEPADLNICTMVGTDARQLSEEIAALPEVERVTLTNAPVSDYLFYGDDFYNVTACDTLDGNPIYAPVEGRLPKHDNELMMTALTARKKGLAVGDTIRLRDASLEADYLICGLVDVPFNLFDMVYMTEDGYRRVVPSYLPNQINLFLKKGCDPEQFKKQLFETYGAPVTDNHVPEGDLEARLQATADKAASDLLELYDVKYMEYAIQIGDQVITGSSAKFRIKSALFGVEELIGLLSGVIQSITLGTGIFMGLAVVTMVLIIWLVVYSSVKKQRLSLGILKGMGYTSRELMLQTALKILPVLIISIVFGSIAGVAVSRAAFSALGTITISVWKIVLAAIGVLVLGFAAAYLSARKIKNISVYELMQE